MCVVQIPSPWAIVASRCTWVPIEPADHRRLGLAQLRELRRDVRHRAVVLAELPAAGDRRGRGSVALGRQGRGEDLGPVDRRTGCPLTAASTAWRTHFQAGELLLGDRADGVRAARGRDVPQRGQREVVVGVRERRAAGVGEVEAPGRTATAPMRVTG